MPSRFRRERLLIVGCGDVGLRLAKRVHARVRVLALTSSPQRVSELRSQHCTPLLGNLDVASSVWRLAGVATRVLHLAPPPGHGDADSRTVALIHALRMRSLPLRLVYASTSGVYGDCGGAWVDETHRVQARTARAARRLHAEQTVRFLGRSARVSASILRVPGIYAKDREGGTPLARLCKATPVLQAEEDVYTNHIHADDLARACALALWRAKPQRVYNISDDTQFKMGDYFDFAADLYGLVRPPRISREAAQAQLPPLQFSFMQESRRLKNERMKQELRLRLRYPTVKQGLA